MTEQLRGRRRYLLVGCGLIGFVTLFAIFIAMIRGLGQISRGPGDGPILSSPVKTEYGLRSGIVQVETTYRTSDAFKQVRAQYARRLNVKDHGYEYNGQMCSMMRDTEAFYLAELHTTILICGSTDEGQRSLIVRGLEVAWPFNPMIWFGY